MTDSSGKYSTYEKCSARCVADAKYKSFGFGGKNCLLFNVAVSGNFDAVSSSSVTFYDRGCVSSSPAPTPSSTASSPKTSSPTSMSSSTSEASTSSSSKPASSTSSSSVKPSGTPSAAPAATSSSNPPGVTVPAGCNVPTKSSMASFRWFNSTHNLDCAGQNYDNGCNGQYPRYKGSFPLTCTHDAGKNATCTAPVPLDLTLVGWV